MQSHLAHCSQGFKDAHLRDAGAILFCDPPNDLDETSIIDICIRLSLPIICQALENCPQLAQAVAVSLQDADETDESGITQTFFCQEHIQRVQLHGMCLRGNFVMATESDFYRCASSHLSHRHVSLENVIFVFMNPDTKRETP